MPVVSVNPTEYQRVELKTAPPDGYVMLRPLPYGMKLSRRSKATKMMMRSQPATSRKQAQQQESVFELESMDEWAVAHDFAYCIGEHNLESAPGKLIDFSTNAIMALKLLDPRVGSEIEQAIDSLNNDEDEESFADFLKRQGMSSSDETPQLNEDGSGSLTTEPQPAG
jgi:hypothetical protein